MLTGATGGLGGVIARLLHRRGAELILTGRNADVLRPLADELSARAVVVDLADPVEVDRLIAESGEIDLLIGNAALPGSGLLPEYTLEQVDRHLMVNLRAPIILARAFSQGMVTRGSGHIVLIGSLSGKSSSPASALYSATKFGLRGFAGGLRQDLHGTGVGVSIVQPGFVSGVGMFADSGAQLPRGMRTISPDAVAEAVASAIEHNSGEVDVAPLEVKAVALLGSVFPELSARILRRMGGGTLAALVEAQREKR
ncbi:SDR family NAD(P)-dependent oxidoreductase [Kribbella antibiotica]|uniref:SDR family NAD(P)-dependent oxidoreductase n=1 Tax=Kribbella antibiotica TaxID=190195 RepID=A0A4R4ZWZ3_9ACTN|nr:SDR family NAD(P)-dependent oxidoreductase [Kribbella antibiotica]